MCESTQSLDRQTAVGGIIEHALYKDNWKALKLNLPTHHKWFDGALRYILRLHRGHALGGKRTLHSVRQRSKLSFGRNDPTMSGGACMYNINLEEHSLHNVRRSMSLRRSWNCHASWNHEDNWITNHRVSLGFRMNSCLHRAHYSQPQLTPLGCHMRKTDIETV